VFVLKGWIGHCQSNDICRVARFVGDNKDAQDPSPEAQAASEFGDIESITGGNYIKLICDIKMDDGLVRFHVALFAQKAHIYVLCSCIVDYTRMGRLPMPSRLLSSIMGKERLLEFMRAEISSFYQIQSQIVNKF